MLAKILIIGGNGNMGRRYRAILDMLKVEHRTYDVAPGQKGCHDELQLELLWCDGIIICTPTASHFQVFLDIVNLDTLKKPILCEKPFSKKLTDVFAACEMAAFEGRPLQMVNQYAELDRSGMSPAAFEGTSYDYFHSGTDGIYWDCINIIGLDKTGIISLKNKSPIWRCILNGLDVSRAEIDASYVSMVRKWLEKPGTNARYMIEAHKKTMAMAQAMDPSAG